MENIQKPNNTTLACGYPDRTTIFILSQNLESFGSKI